MWRICSLADARCMWLPPRQRRPSLARPAASKRGPAASLLLEGLEQRQGSKRQVDQVLHLPHLGLVVGVVLRVHKQERDEAEAAQTELLGQHGRLLVDEVASREGAEHDAGEAGEEEADRRLVADVLLCVRDDAVRAKELVVINKEGDAVPAIVKRVHEIDRRDVDLAAAELEDRLGDAGLCDLERGGRGERGEKGKLGEH
mmetsp:Transcript_16400/g.54504  ORF Transcript_16400/g.54504 Transcript_16400/m.54504 type:complete len:201 (-) Transcript_16400:26-628(-)